MPRMISSRTRRTAARVGLNSGTGAPAHSSTRTSTRLGELTQEVAQPQRILVTAQAKIRA